MSLMQHLSAWIEPFLPHRAPSVDTKAQRQRHLQQAREAEVVLRQLRAELKLMRLWKSEQGRGGAHDG
jgi:hypothetical protein